MHAQAHPHRQDFTYFAQQRGSRLDGFWVSAHLLNSPYLSAIARVKGPLSADHHCIALNLTLPSFTTAAIKATPEATLPVYEYNAQSRHRRATIQPQKEQGFTQHLAGNTDLNKAVETLLGTNPQAWTATAQALTLLQLPLARRTSVQDIKQRQQHKTTAASTPPPPQEPTQK